MKKSIINLSIASALSLACISTVFADEAKEAPGTVTKKVKGGTIKMTPVPAPQPGTITKKVKGGSIQMTPVQAPPQWDFLPNVVAKIGDKEITKTYFKQEAPKVVKYNVPPSKQKEVAKQILDAIINKELLLKLAAKAGFKPSAELVKQDFNDSLKLIDPSQIEQFKAYLKQKNQTMEQYQDDLSKDKDFQDNVAIKKYVEKTIIPKIKKADKAEIDKFYNEHKDSLFKQEVDASHILIKPEDKTPEAKAAAKKKIADILAKVKKGEDFGKLAEKESACPSSKKQGNLGSFGRRVMAPPFEEAAFSLKQGQISDIVETSFGYHIIKLNSIKYTPLDDKVKDYIKNIIREQAISELLKKDVDKEKTTTKVETFIK